MINKVGGVWKRHILFTTLKITAICCNELEIFNSLESVTVSFKAEKNSTGLFGIRVSEIDEFIIIHYNVVCG